MKIEDLVHNAALGEWNIPEFQRDFVWRGEKVKRLAESIIKNYPIGVFLVWKPGELYPYAKSVSDSRIMSWVVDGQQRIVSICLLFGRKPHWMDSDEWNKHFEKMNVLFNINPQDAMGFALPNPIILKDPKWIPVREVLKKKEEDLGEFVSQICRKMSLTEKEYPEVYDRVRRVWEIRSKSILHDELHHEIEDVTEIFTIINRAGTRVREAETYVALVAQKKKGWVRKELIGLTREVRKQGFDLHPGIFIRTLTAIGVNKTTLRQVSDKEFWDDRPKFDDAWKRTKHSILTTIKRLHEKGVLSSRILPSLNALIPLFVLYDRYEVGFDFDQAFYWFLRASWDGRYGGAAITTLEEDIKKIDKGKSLREVVSDLSQPFQVPEFITKEDFLKDYRKERFLRLLMYFVIFDNKARDWLTKARIGFEDGVLATGFEPNFHHFFPRSILRSTGILDEKMNALSNVVIVYGKVNKMMRSNLPEKYVRELKISNDLLGEQLVPIDRSLWKLDKFEDFLDQRAEALAKKTRDYLTELRGSA